MSEQFATNVTTVPVNLKSKSGKVFVFSQEGYGGKYKINTNKGMLSTYGENVTYYRKK